MYFEHKISSALFLIATDTMKFSIEYLSSVIYKPSMHAIAGLRSFWLLCNSALKMAKIGVKRWELRGSGNHVGNSVMCQGARLGRRTMAI